jgi:iron(III) transport system permease protein
MRPALKQSWQALPFPRAASNLRDRLRLDLHTVLFMAVAAILAYLVLPPLFFTVQSSLAPPRGATGLSLRHYVEVFSNPGTLGMVGNTLWFGLGSSAMALVVGTLLAWLVERTNTPFKSLAYLAAFTSLAVPGIIKVIGWILLLGPEAGIINIWLGGVFNIFTLHGMILVEGMIWTPVVFLLMVVPFRSMDPSLEESAYLSGANVARTFFHITFKLAIPAVLSVLILTLVRSLESFEIPALVGVPGGVAVLTTEIYFKIKSGLRPDYGAASAYAVILMLMVSVGLYYYSRISQDSRKFSTITGKGFRPRELDLGRGRYLAGLLLLLLPAIVVLPVLALLWASVLPYYRGPTAEAIATLTFDNYRGVVENLTIVTALKNSVVVAIGAATATIFLTALTAWIIIRTNVPGRWILDHLASFTLVFPGVVLGVALLQTYLALPIPIYGTLWILVLAFMTRYVPFGMRYTSPGLLQISRELEESAQLSGAGWWTTFTRIVLPLMMPVLFGGWIYIFLLAVKELSVALLLYSPGTSVISVKILDMWENGQITELSAFALVVTAALVVIAMVFHQLSMRYGVRAH